MTDAELFILFSSKLYFTHNAVCKALWNNSGKSLMTWNNNLTLSLASCSRYQPLVELLWKQDNLIISTACSVKKVTMVPHLKGFHFQYKRTVAKSNYLIFCLWNLWTFVGGCVRKSVLYEKAATKKTNNVPICCNQRTVSSKWKDLSTARLCLVPNVL